VSRSDVLVIVPAHDEEASLPGTLAELRRAAPWADVLVVDDGSRDATARHAARHGAAVVSHPFNLGYGAALQTGYKCAVRRGYRFVVQMDADGQHDPADVPRLLEPLEGGKADVVIGSRFVEASGYRMGLTRSVGRRFFQVVLVACGGPHISDPTSGFQALGRAAFQFCCADVYPSDFPDIDVLLLLHRHRFRLLEVPVVMAPSPPGRTSMHARLGAVYYTYKMLLSTFRTVLSPPLARVPESAERRSGGGGRRDESERA
jgi:glycosyltransferase involved in cell wall biosynthesis